MTEDEYFDFIDMHSMSNQFTQPLYECPKCGANSVCRNNTVVLTTYPPKSQYQYLTKYGGCGNYVTSK